MTQEVLNTIQNLVLIPVIGAVGTFLTIMLKYGTDLLVEKFKDARVKKYIGLAKDAVLMAVNSTNQQFVDALKQNGTFTSENYKQAFEMSVESAKLLISDKSKEIIIEAHKDFDTWLDNQVYAFVRENKMYKDYPIVTSGSITSGTVVCGQVELPDKTE